jgi:DNA-directed RNA polymerase specialized sigma24 family protein
VTPDETTAAPDLSAVGLAVLSLLVDERESRVADRPDAVPTEVLLDEAGLNSSQIGALVQKTPGAVRMTLSRARTPKKKATKS